MEKISKETGSLIITNLEGPTNYLVISPVNQKDETIMAGLMINNMAQINNLENEDIARKITFKTLFGYMLAINLIIDNLIQNSENPKLVKNINKEDMEIIEQFKELSPILFKTYNLLHEKYK